jgi:hypothetical protein
MPFTPRDRKLIVLAAIISSLGISAYLAAVELLDIETGLVLSLSTIIIPLVAGLYLYRGKLARASFWLAVVAGLCAIVLAVSLIAAVMPFRADCLHRGYSFSNTGDSGYACDGLTEMQSHIKSGIFNGLIPSIAVYAYLIVILLSQLNLIPMIWHLVRRLINKKRARNS